MLCRAACGTRVSACARQAVDGLRTEKQLHMSQLEKMHQKAGKMDEDIAFLTSSAHSALDQREKVKTKFLAAQREMQQERDQKLSIIHDLQKRADTLDEDWGTRDMEMADAEEARDNDCAPHAAHGCVGLGILF